MADYYIDIYIYMASVAEGLLWTCEEGHMLYVEFYKKKILVTFWRLYRACCQLVRRLIWSLWNFSFFFGQIYVEFYKENFSYILKIVCHSISHPRTTHTAQYVTICLLINIKNIFFELFFALN